MNQEIQRHLTDIQLDAFVFEGIALPEASEAHLRACVDCQQRHQALLTLREEFAIARQSTPSPETMARYIQLYSEVNRRTLGDRISDAMDRVRLALSLDSRQMAEAMGLRHGFGFGRRLLFSADTVDVELLVEPAGKLWNIQGDILPFTPDAMSGPYLIQLMGQPYHDSEPGASFRAARREYIAESEVSGRFHLDEIRPGRYHLLLTPSDGPLIEIPALDLS